MVHVFVAGMLANQTYQMHASVQLSNGISLQDPNHSFTTASAPHTAPLQIANSGIQTHEPGIELFDTLIPYTSAQLFKIDLAGDVI